MSKKLFLCYRQDDSAGMTGRLHDRLAAAGFAVFMDVRGIPIGENYIKHLHKEVGKCDALLVMIGPNWLDARGTDPTRRLDDPNDSVRIEIVAALQRQDIPVIPVLLEGAPIPKRHQLPAALEELSERIGIEVRHPSFDEDSNRLIRRLVEGTPADEREVVKKRQAAPGSSPTTTMRVTKVRTLPKSESRPSEWIVRIFVSLAPEDKPSVNFARNLRNRLQVRLSEASPFPITYLFVTDWAEAPDIFVPVLSRFWTSSEQCKDELHQFTRLSPSRPDRVSRITQHIFAIYREAIDPAKLPSVLKGLPKYNFYPSKHINSAESELVKNVSEVGLDLVQFRLPIPQGKDFF